MSADALAFCTAVTVDCPVETSIYGYQPNLGANIFFTVFMATAGISQLVMGIKYRTWSFSIALVLGCICEMIGYVGRILLARNPYDTLGFEIQIICLIIAPTFIAAGLYLTLKHFVIVLGSEHSILPPRLYTWIFISGDILCLILQAAGGVLSASDASFSQLDTGTIVALAGIVLQVVFLVTFGTLAAIYAIRARHHITDKHQNLKRLALAMILPYLTILTRCCYRVPELSGGWRNPVMVSEVDFMILDGGMIATAILALTLFHPGRYLPMGGKSSRAALATKEFDEEV